MNFFVGVVLALAIFAIYSRVSRNDAAKLRPIRISYSQSSIFETVKPALPVLDLLAYKPPMTQARKHYASLFIRVLVMGDSAYWIKDNTFFVADIVDGMVDKNSTKVVDTMGMDKVQLDKMIFIVDTLTEGGQDDHSNSGN